jgi:hypothetical protein
MTYRLTAMLEFESEAQAIDAYNQLSARATNTVVVGMGTVNEHTSYCRVDGPDGMVSSFFVDTFNIVRQGTWVLPPNEYPLFIPPTGAHDSYPVTNAAGEPTRIEYNGRVYQNAHSGLNSWTPPTLWTDLGPAE